MTASVSNQGAPADKTSTGCCPRFDPTQVHEGEQIWKERLFVAEPVAELFHIPLNMVRKVKHATALIRAAGAQPLERPLFLGEEISPFRANIYLEASHYVPEARMITLSGTFLAKVFEGPYADAPRWMAEMQHLAAAHGKHIQRFLFGYTTCPRCSKAYGENYVVLYAQLV